MTRHEHFATQRDPGAGGARGPSRCWDRTRAASAAQEQPATVRLDYAYYNPSSLVLRRFGWLEEALQEQGIGVEWVLSAGSNKANEYLRSEAIDFGSTAGAAALLARANGSPIKTVYIYSKPEWTALVVPADSPITSVADLKGKKVAATKGTDPYFFLLRSLNEAGLSGADVEVVNLQHADGRTALERGEVDAWAGLDPHMAASELEAGSKLLYRNIDFNTYGFLNANEEFIAQYPELQLYRTLDSISSDTHLAFWLRKVAMNRAIDRMRQESRHDREPLTEGTAIVDETAEDDPLLQRRMAELVAQLPPAARAVIVLRYQEDMDPMDIASTLDMSINTVKSHLKRSLTLLRARVQGTAIVEDIR